MYENKIKDNYVTTSVKTLHFHSYAPTVITFIRCSKFFIDERSPFLFFRATTQLISYSLSLTASLIMQAKLSRKIKAARARLSPKPGTTGAPRTSVVPARIWRRARALCIGFHTLRRIMLRYVRPCCITLSELVDCR